MGEVDVFARRGATATAQVQVFTRRASGLVRVMSPYSAFAYNILNIGVIFPWVYITTIAFHAGASVWAGILICGIFTSFLAVVYAGLASAMPRTGGDYVFQSRTLRPWLGVATLATMIITFFLQWQALGGWLLSRLRADPMLTSPWILTNAVANSFTSERTLPIAGTIVVTPVALTSLGWVGYAQDQAGEIQGAQSLKNQMFINFGGGVVSMIMIAILALVIVQTVDQNWLGAAAFLSFNAGLPQPPIPPWFSSLAIMLTDSPILLFLMIVGVALNAIQVAFNVIVGWTRVAVAMSIDGVLPKAVSHVSPRTHTPVTAHVIFLILGGFVFAYVYNLVPGYTTYTLAVTAVATVMYIGTALGGALFPWTRKEVYATAPIAKFKVGPIPLITICGVVAALFSAAMLYYFLTVPFLVNVDMSNLGYSGNLFLYAVLLIFFGWVDR